MGDTINDNTNINWDNVISNEEYEKLPDEVKRKNEENMKEIFKKIDEMAANLGNDEYWLKNYPEDFEPLLKK